MHIKLALASAILVASLPVLAAPVIKGNTQIDSRILDRNISYGNPKSTDDVARIIVETYEKFGYLGVKASVEGDVITVIEPGSEISGDYNRGWVNQGKGQVLEIETLNQSMAMADVNNRFEVMDVVVEDLRDDGRVGVEIKRQKTNKPYVGNVTYSSLGQDASARDLVTLSGGVHVGAGVRVDAALTHGASSLRSESKGGKYRSIYANAKKATPYGEFNASVSDSTNEIGGKDATLYDYQLAGDTRRYTVGHRYVVQGVGTFANQLGWTKRDQSFGLFNLEEEQSYKTWNTRYLGKFGAHQLNASITKGLGGSRDFNLIPLMGEFNPNFYSMQLGYATSGVFPIDSVGYGVSVSAFHGSKDMPSSERMSLGGPGRGSSHNNGVVSGYKGQFGEARLYGMRNLSPIADLSLRPYLSVNGGTTTNASGESLDVYSAEAGLLGRWDSVTGSLSYADTISTKNIDKDRRMNMNLNYEF